MNDLASWVLEQIAEDETAAPLTHHRECATATDWYFGGQSECDCGVPARVLAECDAKRRLVTEVVDKVEELEDFFETECRGDYRDGNDAKWYETSENLLKLLALPYAGRPGYREDWRP